MKRLDPTALATGIQPVIGAALGIAPEYVSRLSQVDSCRRIEQGACRIQPGLPSRRGAARRGR
jgi:hypothetical protein